MINKYNDNIQIMTIKHFFKKIFANYKKKLEMSFTTLEVCIIFCRKFPDFKQK